MDNGDKLNTSKQSWSITTLPEMDTEQFEQWQTLLEKRTGMRLTPSRKTFLQTGLGVRMREIGCKSYKEYYDQILSGPKGAIEWATLVDRLTVQETSFFRHPKSYELVRRYINSRPYEEAKSRPLEIWSVGCSTGEEAYSLAMLADEVTSNKLNTSGKERFYGVTGTDISVPVLAKARRGIYSNRKLISVQPALRQRFFKPVGHGNSQVSDELRDRVCFIQTNILELNKSPMQDLDIIYCQNVLIYFRRWRRREILNRLAEKLKPGGILVIGLGEIVDWKHPDLDPMPDNSTLAFIKRKEPT